jgi:hypothetical protein
MFSAIVPENRNPSWGTTPSCDRNERSVTSRRSWPSTSTRPSVGSWKRATSFAKVDLPAPVAPTSATVCPGATVRSTRSSARVDSSPTEYSNDTPSKRISPRTSGSAIASGPSSISGSSSSSSKILSSAAMPAW